MENNWICTIYVGALTSALFGFPGFLRMFHNIFDKQYSFALN